MNTAQANLDVVRYLANKYYGSGDAAANTELISSHWTELGGRAEVKTDDSGNIVSLAGLGFGTTKWSSPGHRLMDSLTIWSHLTHLSNRLSIYHMHRLAQKVSRAMGLDPTSDVFRQSCTVDLLKRNIPEDMQNTRMRFLMIGDGFGVLAALFKAVFPSSTIFLVDLGRTLLFQSYHCGKAYPDSAHVLVDNLVDPNNADFVYCPTENLDMLDQFKFHGAVNISSMGEMTIPAIERYFEFFRNHFEEDNFFYCCNREFKVLVGGERTEFYQYPWSEKDEHLIDKVCPWYRYHIGWTLRKNHITRVPVPFINIRNKIFHRLTRLSTSD
jgi:putative sugar O-methyltransferase